MFFGIGESFAYFLGDGDGSCGCEGAVIESRAGDDVADGVVVGCCEVAFVELLPDIEEVLQGYVGEDEILVVGDANFGEAVLFCECGNSSHLF